MSGRYSGPVRFFYLGDESVARQYNGIARKLVAYLQNQSELVRDNMWTASRRVKISDGVIIEVRKVTDLIYNAYIDARGATAPSPILRILQYQFVYTGGAGKLWDIYQFASGFPIAGGSIVGVVFLIREDRVDHVAVPLFSTLLESPDSEWVYRSTLLTEEAQQALFASLLIPRYEIVHASSQHLFQPDEENIVHSAWMSKGVRHYMASVFTASTMQQAGSLAMDVDNSTSPPSITPVDAVWLGDSTTDVGFETDLASYVRPIGTLSEFQAGPKKGAHDNSAPDSDWYTSYAVQEVELPDGSLRKFGVFIDASQTVRVWPLEAAGTDVPDPAYQSQFIKTNVAPTYVKSAPLVFPAGVYSSTPSFRDSFLGDDNVKFDGPLEDATRYIWHPKSDGTEFVTIVEKETPELNPVRYTGEAVAGALPYYLLNNKAHRAFSPEPAKVQIAITQSEFSNALEDFTITVSLVELLPYGDNIYPVQVRYAAEESFQGVQKDTILIAGFRVHRVDDSVDGWDFLQAVNGDASLLPGVSVLPDYFNLFNCHAVQVTGLPVLLDQGEYYNDNSKGTTYNDGGVEVTRNGHYQYNMPRYMVQDMPFTRLGAISEQLNNEGQPTQPRLAELSPYRKSFVLEAEFVVQSGSTDVFTVCCRKFKPNEFDFGNFFTARVCSADVSTGTFVFGLCESTTWIGTVERPIPRWPEGFFGDWSVEEGVNTSVKGYALFYKGEQVSTDASTLALQLDTPLDSPVLDKDLSFWGCLRPGRVLILPPLASGEYGFSSFFFNTDYIAHLAGLVGNQIELLQNFYYGFRDFPWGLEMASWVAHNHFKAYGSQQAIAGTDIVAYTGAYLDISSSMRINPLSHEFVVPPNVEMKNVDTILVAGIPFTHAQLYNEAFSEAADLDFNVSFESKDVSPVEGTPPVSVGYPIRKGSSDWDSQLMFAPLGVASEQDGANEWAINMLLPEARVYCDTSGFPMRLRFFDYVPNQNVAIASRNGIIRSPFQARCFGRVELEE